MLATFAGATATPRGHVPSLHTVLYDLGHGTDGLQELQAVLLGCSKPSLSAKQLYLRGQRAATDGDPIPQHFRQWHRLVQHCNELDMNRHI